MNTALSYKEAASNGLEHVREILFLDSDEQAVSALMTLAIHALEFSDDFGMLTVCNPAMCGIGERLPVLTRHWAHATSQSDPAPGTKIVDVWFHEATLEWLQDAGDTLATATPEETVQALADIAARVLPYIDRTGVLEILEPGNSRPVSMGIVPRP